MGIFKAIGFFVTGGAIRPTTTRERSRMYQRRANNLLEDQLNVMQNLAQQQFIQVPTDARPRGTCPACLELMVVGASTCPSCQTTRITWPSAPNQTSVSNRRDAYGGLYELAEYIIKSPEEKLKEKIAFAAQVNEKHQAQRDFNKRWRKTKRLKRRQAAKELRLMRQNRAIVERHGIKNSSELIQVLEDYRIMEEHKDLVLKHSLTDAGQVRAYLVNQIREEFRTQQLEEKKAQRVKARQQQVEADARRKLREAEEAERLAQKQVDKRALLAEAMHQFGLEVQKCLNPEEGIGISEVELRVAFGSIRKSLSENHELSQTSIAKYERIISDLSATVTQKTGYQNL
jgi:hypothetical protein